MPKRTKTETKQDLVEVVVPDKKGKLPRDHYHKKGIYKKLDIIRMWRHENRSIRWIATKLDISPSTLNLARQKYPEFDEVLKDRDNTRGGIEHNLWDAALSRSTTETKTTEVYDYKYHTDEDTGETIQTEILVERKVVTTVKEGVNMKAIQQALPYLSQQWRGLNEKTIVIENGVSNTEADKVSIPLEQIKIPTAKDALEMLNKITKTRHTHLIDKRPDGVNFDPKTGNPVSVKVLDPDFDMEADDDENDG